MIVELDEPSYDARARKLRFAARPIGTGSPPASFGTVSITIDEGHTVTDYPIEN